MFVLLVLGGLVILYALLTLVVTISFWTIAVDQVTELIYVVLETGRYPASAMPQPLRTLITYVPHRVYFHRAGRGAAGPGDHGRSVVVLGVCRWVAGAVDLVLEGGGAALRQRVVVVVTGEKPQIGSCACTIWNPATTQALLPSPTSQQHRVK